VSRGIGSPAAGALAASFRPRRPCRSVTPSSRHRSQCGTCQRRSSSGPGNPAAGLGPGFSCHQLCRARGTARRKLGLDPARHLLLLGRGGGSPPARPGNVVQGRKASSYPSESGKNSSECSREGGRASGGGVRDGVGGVGRAAAGMCGPGRRIRAVRVCMGAGSYKCPARKRRAQDH